MINGLFSINGLRTSFFVKCPLSFSFCVPLTRPLFFGVLFGMIPNFVLCLASYNVLSTCQNDMSTHQPPNAYPSTSLSSTSFTPQSWLLTPCTSNPAADNTQIAHPSPADAMPQQLSLMKADNRDAQSDNKKTNIVNACTWKQTTETLCQCKL